MIIVACRFLGVYCREAWGNSSEAGRLLSGSVTLDGYSISRDTISLNDRIDAEPYAVAADTLLRIMTSCRKGYRSTNLTFETQGLLAALAVIRSSSDAKDQLFRHGYFHQQLLYVEEDGRKTELTSCLVSHRHGIQKPAIAPPFEASGSPFCLEVGRVSSAGQRYMTSIPLPLGSALGVLWGARFGS